MARNGSGTFSLLNTLAPPGQENNSTNINATMDDIATALTDSVNKDGTKAFAANQAMGGHKLTGLGAGTAGTDSLSLTQAQSEVYAHATAVGGSADAITATFSPVFTAWTANMRFRWTSSGVNTVTGPTINVDSLGAKTIKKGASAVLAAGDIGASGYICEAIYNGTDVILLNPSAVTSAGATTTEQLTGTLASVFSTPDSVAALWEAGADIADGAAITIGEGGYFNLITSTTAITSFVVTTSKAGRTFRCRFNTARTLTHNGTSLILPGAKDITTAQGDICQFRDLGSGNVVCEWYTYASISPRSGGAPDVIVEDQKAQNTAGGTFNNGADRIRVLNTLDRNVGTLASLASNQITLPAGKYYISWSALGVQVDNHQSFLYNVTGASEIKRSLSSFGSLSSGSTSVTFAVSTAIELRHRCTTSAATTGFGSPCNFGTEIYARVEIWRIA